MLNLPPSVRIFVSREPADMRKGFDSLAQLVRPGRRSAVGPSLRVSLEARRSPQGALLGFGWAYAISRPVVANTVMQKAQTLMFIAQAQAQASQTPAALLTAKAIENP